jgi:hypothetical protein
MTSIPQAELAVLMADSANDAITYAAEEHHVLLDLTAQSLDSVEQLLTKLALQHQERRFSDAVLFTLANIFGAYLGQVFVGVVGGKWQQQQTDDDSPYVTLSYNGKDFPLASLCYHKLAKDRSINVRDYLAKAMSNAMQ